MRKISEQRASSVNRARRREKLAARFPSLERKDNIRQLTNEQYLDLIPQKKSSRCEANTMIQTDIPLNLPEFLNFQSDHLLLLLLTGHIHCNSRSSTISTNSTKFVRPSTNSHHRSSSPKITPHLAVNCSRSHYTTNKRSSRSRQTHETTFNHVLSSSPHSTHSHLVRPISLRQMTTKFDSMRCFEEVSRFVILSLSSRKHSVPEGTQMVTRTKTTHIH